MALGRKEAEIRTLSAVYRAPAFHFVVLGAAAFALAAAMPDTATRAAGPDRRIHISAEDVQRLEIRYKADTGISPDPAATAALIRREINERILYREALALGLDRNDRAIASRLVEKAQYLGEAGEESDQYAYDRALALGLDREDPVVRRILIQKLRMLVRFAGESEPPDDETLQRHLQEHPGRYTDPARADLVHVYLDRAKRGEALGTDSERILTQLRENGAPDSSGRLPGDAFLAGHRFANASQPSLAKLFGDRFAAQALNAQERSWSGPVASAGGLHFLWVDNKTAERVADLESVKDRVRRSVMAEQRDRRLENFLQKRRADYEIVVDAQGADGANG